MGRLSKECYIPLLKIRFLRIYNLLDTTVFLNLYFSHKHKKDNYYCILYDIVKNQRYLLYFTGEDEPIILWTE